MILELYITLLALSIIIVIAGKYLEGPPLQLTGYTFLFILGLVLLSGLIEYKSGEIKSYNYACDYLCDNHSLVNATGAHVISSIVEQDTYSSFDTEIILGITLNHVFGLFIMLLSAFGWIITLFNLKPGIEGDQQHGGRQL